MSFDRYVARPLPVFAMQWTGDNAFLLNEALEEYKKKNKLTDTDIIGRFTMQDGALYIITMEGALSEPIRVGNYIVIGMRHELYPCDRAIPNAIWFQEKA